MSAAAKVIRDGQSGVFHCLKAVSVNALSRRYQRNKSVNPKLLSFRRFDRIRTGAQRDVGRGEPFLDVELFGQENSFNGIDVDINIFNFGNGATVHPLQPIDVGYGEKIHPLGSGGFVIVIHPISIAWMRKVLIRTACGDLPFIEEPPQGSELGGSNVLQVDCVVLGTGNDGFQRL